MLLPAGQAQAGISAGCHRSPALVGLGTQQGPLSVEDRALPPRIPGAFRETARLEPRAARDGESERFPSEFLPLNVQPPFQAERVWPQVPARGRVGPSSATLTAHREIPAP